MIEDSPLFCGKYRRFGHGCPIHAEHAFCPVVDHQRAIAVQLIGDYTVAHDAPLVLMVPIYIP
jgi:hypothetical protein